MGYLLNPYCLYKDHQTGYERDVSNAFNKVVEVFYPSQESVHDDIMNVDFLMYWNKDGSFGRGTAIRSIDRSDYDPGF